MTKVYHLDGQFRDWQTGKPLPDQAYEGKFYSIGPKISAWMNTWLENGERAYQGISNLCLACNGKLIEHNDGYRYCARCGLIPEGEES